MRRFKTNRKPYSEYTLPNKALVLWCDGNPDGFCYSLEIQNGFIGILSQGGISGDLTRFFPLLPFGKGD